MLISYVIRVTVAALFGAAIGLERDLHGRAAGLRTHMLVSAGSALFTVLSEIVAKGVIAEGGPSDPGRIAAQVVTGIGFLGAGVIIKEGFSVRGLTTAACLWIVAAIGMACGMGQYSLAAATTVLSVVCLVLLKALERRLKHDSYRSLVVVTKNGFDVQRIVGLVETDEINVQHVSFECDYESGRTSTRLTIRVRHRGLTDQIASEIVKSLESAEIPLCRLHWGKEWPA